MDKQSGADKSKDKTIDGSNDVNPDHPHKTKSRDPANGNSSLWSSRLAFILASAGAAVGLGNIWRFPYVTGQNGGAAFVLVYLGFVLLLGIPLMMSEIVIGRYGRQNPSFAMGHIAQAERHSRLWRFPGMIPIVAGFLILSYYAVIAGWVLDFLAHSTTNTFNKITVEQADKLFSNLLANPWQLVFWDSIVVIAAVIVIGKGIHKGLEKTVYVMFPTLLIIMAVLILYAIETGSFFKGFHFLFAPQFHLLNVKAILLALGQAFFSLGIGTGIMLTYGKYVSMETNITNTSIQISLADTGVALLAGLTIFPIVFAQGLAPSTGPSLIFKSLPVAFSHIEYGAYFAMLFFLMLELAAFTSVIALLEPSVVYLMERFQLSRLMATTFAGIGIWVLSIGTISSFNHTAHITFFGLNFFEFLDYTTSNILLPIGGLSVALFTGWAMSKETTAKALQLHQSQLKFRLWRTSVRYISPLAISLIFLSTIGLL